MNKIIILLLFLWVGLGSVRGQGHITHFCGQPEAWERLRLRHPGADLSRSRAASFLETYTREFALQEDRGGDQEIYIIPVVFHIIHDNGEENISDEQILNAVEILNRDFRMQNNDVTLVVDAFEPLAADAGIEFRLATRDPNGQCTTGINRVVSDLTYSGDEEMKALIYWPRHRYLNIWVCADANGAAGYTFLPPAVSNTWDAWVDGIVIRSDYTGSIGTSTSTRSRTLTHEVGHWLNLYHTWGDNNTPGLASNCNLDDQVDDTPNTLGWTSCTLTGSSCGSELDNVQNYMEYSYCSRMFTQGQITRMRAALTSPVAQRNQLITPTTHTLTGVLNPPLCEAAFTVDRNSGCVGEAFEFTDRSFHAVATWTWDFGDGTVLSGSDPLVHQNPSHIYSEAGTYTVSLLVSNSSGELEVTYQNLVSVLSEGGLEAPFAEGFESLWPASGWQVSNAANDLGWEVTPTASFSGTKCLRLRNFNTTIENSTDEMLSATFDFSGADTVWISYRWAYANKLNETDDRLRISVSPDCGASWQLVRIRKGLTNLPTSDPQNTSFTPSTAAQWDGETLQVTDPALLTSTFRVKFEFVAKGGNNVFLDDINIWASLGSVGLMEDADLAEWTVYPNPSGGDVEVLWNILPDELIRVDLLDAAGRICWQGFPARIAGGGGRLALPPQAPGMYFIRVSGAGISGVRRVVFR